jgi:hypothetical protein
MKTIITMTAIGLGMFAMAGSAKADVITVGHHGGGSHHHHGNHGGHHHGGWGHGSGWHHGGGWNHGGWGHHHHHHYRPYRPYGYGRPYYRGGVSVYTPGFGFFYSR